MRGIIPPLSQYIFMARSLIKHRDTFTFTNYRGMDMVNRTGLGIRLWSLCIKVKPKPNVCVSVSSSEF